MDIVKKQFQIGSIKDDVQRFKDISINECFEQVDTDDSNGMTIVSAPFIIFLIHTLMMILEVNQMS